MKNLKFIKGDIHGVIITKLKQIKDERGSIFTMIRSDSELFNNFGEIYFSTVFHNSIKAWRKHKKAVLNYVCIKGKIRLVLFDDRKESRSFGKFNEYILSPNDYFLITIPPQIWNGFIGLDNEESIIANLINIPHDEKEMTRKSFNDDYLNYNWGN